MNPSLLRSVPGVVLVLAGLWAGPIHAQLLPPNTRVRVTSADARVVGNVMLSTPDSLSIIVDQGRRKTTDWKDVSVLECSAGKHGHAGRGALIGAGVMTGLTVGALLFGGSDDEYGDDYGDTILILALPLNAALGAGVGALVGLAWRTERWVAVPFYAPTGGGTGSLGVAYKF